MVTRKIHQAHKHISLEDYNRIFDAQNGCCAICGRHQSELDKRLSVDHDHETGEVRGLLCHGCNLGLGYFKDSPTRLSNASAYLQNCGTGIFLSALPITYKWRKKDGITRTGHGDWRYVDKDDVTNLSVSELMEKYNASRSTVFSWKQRSRT